MCSMGCAPAPQSHLKERQRPALAGGFSVVFTIIVLTPSALQTTNSKAKPPYDKAKYYHQTDRNAASNDERDYCASGRYFHRHYGLKSRAVHSSPRSNWSEAINTPVSDMISPPILEAPASVAMRREMQSSSVATLYTLTL